MLTVRIAGLNIGIENRYSEVAQFFRNYLTECVSPDFFVFVSEKEISREINATSIKISSAYAERACILRAINKKLPEYDAYLFHAAVVECCGMAYAFAAVSGTGKSTHARMWIEKFGRDARIINGDKPIIRWRGSIPYIYGTPWCGKEGYNINTKVPLAAICFIEQGEKNKIRSSARHESVRRLIKQIILPSGAEEVSCFMRLIDRTVMEVPCWALSCVISPEAATLAYEAMKIKSAFNESPENVKL